jgi:hypothetical protein
MQDAAKETGETLVISSGGGGLGNYYARMEAPGARVLDTLAPTWWMRTDGKTEVGVRVSKVIVSKFDVLKEGTNLALGKITIATDNPEDWQPGAQFLAPQFGEIRTVSSAVHKLDGGKLRTEAWINP